MRQTLLRIPLDAPWSLGPLGEIPGFGFGIVLVLWIIVAAVWFWKFRKELQLGPELIVPVALWLAIAFVIVRLPAFVQRDANDTIRATTQAIDAGDARPEAWLHRARAFQAKHDYVRAAEDFRRAAAGSDGLREASRDLAWMLATCPVDSIRDGESALVEAKKAVNVESSLDAWSLDVLAAAQAESGRFDEAIHTARRAAVLANETGTAEISRRLPGIRERLALYQDHRPWREPRVGKAIPVYGYGFMLFLAFFVSGWWGVRRAATIGISSDVIWDVALWVFFAGIAGARLFYIAQYPGRVFGNATGIGKLFAVFNLPDGGLVLYGGVLMGIVAFLLYCRRAGLSAARLADVIIPSIFLGVAFGRIGCFLNGCCYGDSCDLPWGVTFPAGSVPDVSLVTQGFLAADEVVSRISLHPTQVYSAIDGLVLAFLTASYFRRPHRDGAVVVLGWLCYPITRFLIEYVRNDEPAVVLPIRTLLFWGSETGRLETPFTISQWVSIGLFAAGLVYLWWWNRGAKTISLTGATPSTAAVSG